MIRVRKEIPAILLISLLCCSAAYGEIDLSIPSPAVSLQGDFYPDSPVILFPGTEIMPPVPAPAGGMLSLNLRAANFPQGTGQLIDFYLILKAADTGRTYYAEFDILKLIMGGFDLSEAISLRETPAPFLGDLSVASDIDIVIPIRTRDIDLSQGNYFAIAVFTGAGSEVTLGDRAVGKIRVYGQDVCCIPERPVDPGTGK